MTWAPSRSSWVQSRPRRSREDRLWWICRASVLLPEPIVPNEKRSSPTAANLHRCHSSCRGRRAQNHQMRSLVVGAGVPEQVVEGVAVEVAGRGRRRRAGPRSTL